VIEVSPWPPDAILEIYTWATCLLGLLMLLILPWENRR
jgi:hypothetical protein